MQIQNGTQLFVVSSDGMSPVAFGSLHNAIKGGLRMEDVEVFTVEEEAKAANRARSRRRCVSEFSNTQMLAAAKLALLDNDGTVMREIPLELPF